jgi:hypothetical protein
VKLPHSHLLPKLRILWALSPNLLYSFVAGCLATRFATSFISTSC